MKSNLQLLTRLIFLLKIQIQKNLIKNSLVQVNLCQKLLFLSQLTHSMMTSCSLNYKFNTWKFQTKTYVVYINCSKYQSKIKQKQFLYTTFSEHGIFMYWTVVLLSYFGLVDAKIRGSDNYLPVMPCTCNLGFTTDSGSLFGPILQVPTSW